MGPFKPSFALELDKTRGQLFPEPAEIAADASWQFPMLGSERFYGIFPVGEGNLRGVPMIELLFVTCLTVSPTQCQDRSLLFSSEVGLMACMLHGQRQLAEWTESHPRERVQKWGCRLRIKGQVET